MTIKVLIKKKMYQDSLKLMGISRILNEIEGIQKAMVGMATETNIDLFKRLGLYTKEAEGASADDIIIAIKSSNEIILERAVGIAEAELVGKGKSQAGSGSTRNISIKTIKSAVRHFPKSNLALISVPGQFAAKEAHNALDNGLNVMIFSDNVSIKDEVELKQKAQCKGLLVMGPDCGTSIINGVKLGFANEVQRGPIGIVGASGTGIQEITAIIDRLGSGISHAIGTGGRDLSKEVGGITMQMALDMLDNDDSTKIIVITSKPPAKDVAKKIIDRAKQSKKTIIINFLGLDNSRTYGIDNLRYATTLEEAALEAVKELNKVDKKPGQPFKIDSTLKEQLTTLGKNRKLVKGFYTGGTLAGEALTILRQYVDVNSNLDNSTFGDNKNAHVILDLGDDEYTKGRPHPMIDPTMRNQYILEEANDANVAIIMLDVVIGYGSHSDPARVLAPIIKDIKDVVFLVHVCGTELDHQVLSKQENILLQSGAHVFETNAQMSRAAVAMIKCLE